MTTLQKLLDKASNTNYFRTLENYASFCKEYLEYIREGLQARIVADNEHNYIFFQYRDGYAISRPINSNLFYTIENIDSKQEVFFRILKNMRDIRHQPELRAILNQYIYTCQIAIGATLDASRESNATRKQYGESFENFMRLIIQRLGIRVGSGFSKNKISEGGEIIAEYNSQHDIILYDEHEAIKAIGSVKTSSKDRMKEIFFDRLLYNTVTHSKTPHFAIFLNDTQRINSKKKSAYRDISSFDPQRSGVTSTFVAQQFKVYTILLSPLEGVYYCDLRPNMISDSFLRQHIRTLDYFFVEDIWQY